ncbi:MAG: hypothetical protein ACI841_002057 [Planctomycetota bacterium]|jgi:hypothetical protein
MAGRWRNDNREPLVQAQMFAASHGPLVEADPRLLFLASRAPLGVLENGCKSRSEVRSSSAASAGSGASTSNPT